MVKRSPIWEYFDQPTAEDHRCASCKICKQKVAAGDSNTANLKTHLRTHHPVQYGKLSTASSASSRPTSSNPKPEKTNPIKTAIDKLTAYKKDGDTKKKLDSAVTYCIAKDAMPFNTVEKKGLLPHAP